MFLLFIHRENFDFFDASCDAYDCQVKYVHTFSCVHYFHEQYDIDCAIPCLLRNCTQKIFHKWTSCPIWKCSTDLTPINPALPLDHPMSVATIVLSLLGTMMLTLILTFVAIKTKRAYDRRNHQRLFPEANENPIYSKLLNCKIIFFLPE